MCKLRMIWPLKVTRVFTGVFRVCLCLSYSACVLCVTEDLDHADVPEGRMRKSRSHSFSSSLRRLFKGKKSKKDASRESSLSRVSGRYDTSREGSMAQQHSPDMSYNNRDMTLMRQGTPNPEYPEQGTYQYSVSVPANPSPLYDH